jgi:hypothetical protein
MAIIRTAPPRRTAAVSKTATFACCFRGQSALAIFGYREIIRISFATVEIDAPCHGTAEAHGTSELRLQLDRFLLTALARSCAWSSLDV